MSKLISNTLIEYSNFISLVAGKSPIFTKFNAPEDLAGPGFIRYNDDIELNFPVLLSDLMEL